MLNSKFSVGGCGGGSGGGHSGFGNGGGGGKRPRNERPRGIHDRYCTHCGVLIYNQTVDKPVICPITTCRMRLFLRDGNYGNPHDWLRCIDCDSFLKDDMAYCQQCGRGQSQAIRKRELAMKHAAEAAKRKVEEENRRLEEINKMKENELAQKDLELEELRKKVKLMDEELFRSLPELDSDEEMAESFPEPTKKNGNEEAREHEAVNDGGEGEGSNGKDFGGNGGAGNEVQPS